MTKSINTRIVNKSGTQFNVVTGRYDSFWDRFENNWEVTSFRAFDAHFADGGTFLDIGSWIGPMALYAASNGQRVICIEADPAALAALRENIAVNPDIAHRITVIDRAIYHTSGEIQFGTKNPGNSESSIFTISADNVWTVATITPSEIADIIGETSSLLVKMDIEGGEYVVFPPLFSSLKAFNPSYVVSLHPAHIPNGYLETRKLSRAIFTLCKGHIPSRLRDEPRIARSLRERFVRSAWCPAIPRGTWLFAHM